MRSTLVTALALAGLACTSDPTPPGPSTPVADAAVVVPGEDAGTSVGADAAVAPDVGVEPALTYFRDIKPIVDAKCGGCHAPGAVGPFSLSTYAELSSTRALVELAVRDRRMPPWHADNDCNGYTNDRSLSEAQREAILAWVALGGPEGRPEDEPAPLPVSDPGLTRVDLRLPVEGAYTPEEGDDYRCFVFEWPETAPRYVTGYNLVPTNPAIVHHANIYSIAAANAPEYRTRQAADAVPGYRCFGGVFSAGTTLLGSWAPGSHGVEFPGNAGILVEPGTIVVAEIHFNTDAGRGADQSELHFKIDDTVHRRALIVPFWNFFEWPTAGGMPIPAGEADVRHAYEFDPGPFRNVAAPWIGQDELLIHGVGMHMHQLGKSGRIEVRRAGAGTGPTTQCMLDIPRWDFSWQTSYLLREAQPFTLGADRLFVECHFDNSAENQPIVGGQKLPTRDVSWGNGSRDEMCIGYVLLTER